MSTLAGNVAAKDEYRKPHLTWRLYGGASGDFDSAEAAVNAFNAKQEAAYAACTSQNCGSCSKMIHSAPTSISFGNGIINGQYTVKAATSLVLTTYAPACTVDGVLIRQASGPTSTTMAGGIATVLTIWCPPGLGSGALTRTIGTTTIEGKLVTISEMTCKRAVYEPPPQSCPAADTFGNPINATMGSKVVDETDYASADALLSVRRSYSSNVGQWAWSHAAALADLTGRSSTVSPSTDLVANIALIPPGIYVNSVAPAAVPTSVSFPLAKTVWDDGQKEASVTSGGRRDVFTEGSAGAFSTPSLPKPQLTVNTGTDGTNQWRVQRPAGTFEAFGSDGNLLQVVSRDGKSVIYQRQGQTLTTTAVPSGRSIVLSNRNAQAAPGTYDTITLPDATQIRYQIDSAALVTSVTYPDGTSKTYVYDESAKTGLPDATRLGLLTGLIDESGVRAGTYTYDPGYSTAKTTERAGGVDKYTTTVYPYNGRTDIVLPTTGAPLVSVNWELGPDGERRVTRRSQPAGAGCAASSSAMTFDSNGNIASANDFDGHRACYASDLSRNLETTRVEGLLNTAACSSVTPANATLPANSRKVSTQWHPDWRLKTQQAEPGKLTTSVYNGQPDPFNANATASCAPSTALLPDGKPIAVLCKQVEQATTDADGHLGFTAALQTGVPNRVTSWTYNPYGQVLTALDPLNQTTTYAYYTDTSFTGTDPNAVGHTMGDLQTMTNALGQITQYTQYDKNGNLLQSTDPNGVVTTNTYDPRQRLTGTSVAGQTTTYAYWPTGLLKQATQPDGSSVAYSYDDAHRLVAITDNLGNRVDYTLDNAGNKTAETIKDPGGALSRQLSRAFDALGRVQQTTGRE